MGRYRLGKKFIRLPHSRRNGHGRWRYSDFQGGIIFWSPETGAHIIHGAIMPKWIGVGGSRSFLGYPLADEMVAPDGYGHYVHFEGGSIC